jgi:hypothetical protein
MLPAKLILKMIRQVHLSHFVFYGGAVSSELSALVQRVNWKAGRPSENEISDTWNVVISRAADGNWIIFKIPERHGPPLMISARFDCATRLCATVWRLACPICTNFQGKDFHDTSTSNKYLWFSLELRGNHDQPPRRGFIDLQASSEIHSIEDPFPSLAFT